MKIIISFLFTISFILNSYAQNESIYFDTDKSDIRLSENDKLLNINKQYHEGTYELLLIGHCDVAGSDSYNMILSQKRANRVKEYFVNQQVLEQDIRIDFQGETKADQVAQMYRKVEIFLIPKPKPVKEEIIPEIPLLTEAEIIEEDGYTEAVGSVEDVLEEEVEDFIPTPKENGKLSYEDFMESVKPKVQTFKFNQEEMNIVVGDKGTIIRIPENAFVYENGLAARHEIVFKLTEYYSKKEFVFEELSTITDGNLLKSAGMIHVEAKSMNDQLKLAEGKDIEILFPEMKEKYSTYYGERDSEGNLNWKIDERYTRIQEDNIENYGVTTTLDGEGLELVTKDEIKRRNKNANFRGKNGEMRAITQEEVDFVKEEVRFWEAKSKEKTLIKSKKLGLINCDRIIDDENAQAIEFMVEATNKDVETISAFLILKNYNSVMKVNRAEGNIFYINARMPIGEEARLLVTGLDKEGNFYMYNKIISIAKKTEEKVVLEGSSYGELDKLLEG